MNNQLKSFIFQDSRTFSAGAVERIQATTKEEAISILSEGVDDVKEFDLIQVKNLNR